MRVVASRRIEMAVGQPIVDRGQAGRAGVARERHLHRRRLAREDQQPIAFEMERRVDQHVDSIAPDQCRDLLVGLGSDLAPFVGEPPEPFGHRVVDAIARVADDFHRLAVVLAPERQQIAADHVIAKQPADVSDAKAPPGRTIVVVPRASRLRKAFGMPPAPLDVLRQQRSTRRTGDGTAA